MLNLLDGITPADLIAFSRRVPIPAEYALTGPNGVLPDRQTNNVRYRLRNREMRVVAARYRTFDAPTPFGRREVLQAVSEGELPPLGQAFLVGELQTILLAIDRGADNSAIIEEVFDLAQIATEAVYSRMELGAGDVLTDGRLTLSGENGIFQEADFAVPAANLPVAGVVWGDPVNSRPLLDELTWRDVKRRGGGGDHGDVMTSRRVFGNLLRSNEYRGLFYGETAAGGANRPTLNPGQLQTVRDTYGLPPIRQYDAEVRVQDDGASFARSVRPIPDDRYLLLPAEKRNFGESLYGLTAEGIQLRGGSNPRIERDTAPGIVVTAYEQDNPVAVVTKSSATALPILQDSDDYVCARVL